MSKNIHKAVADYLATLQAEPVPKGWHRLSDLAERHGTGERNIQLILSRLIKHGQAERRQFPVKVATGVKPVMHYRLSKDAAKAFGLT